MRYSRNESVSGERRPPAVCKVRLLRYNMTETPLPMIPDAAIAAVYTELRRLAVLYMKRERSGHTLQPTALVNEAFLRLAQQRNVQWHNKSQFLGVAAPMMRRILVDHSRRRHAAKRGDAVEAIPFEQAVLPVIQRPADVVALDEALNALAGCDSQQVRIVELRFFSGLSIEQTADVLGVSASTVKREWNIAKAWLAREIHDSGS
jgi:RNA polymerase sigma-70 factor, ECF subfamily